MIYGIMASAGEGDLPPPVWTDALNGTFDFVNGLYSWRGVTLTESQIIDRTDWLGTGGLEVPASAGAGAEIIHSGICDLLASCQFTIVFEIETVGYDQQYILTATSASDTYYIFVEYYAGFFDVQDNNDVGSRIAQGEHDYHIGGTHVIAATRVDAALSLSTDGNTAETGGPSGRTMPVVGSPLINFYLGGWSSGTYDAVNIHSMKIYTAQADEDLPGLSA